MKFFLIVASSSIFILFTAGCNKILEVKPQSDITEQVFFRNERDFEPNLAGIYTGLRTFANNITYGTERSEELTSAINSRFSVAWAQNLSPSSGSLNYADWYRFIGHCNLLLSKIEAFSFSAAPDEKKRIVGETYALRAFFFFHLFRIIGDLPLMLEPVVDENVPLLPRSSSPEVMEQILKDIEQAKQSFMSMSNFDASKYPSKYRFSYGALMALKADALLWKYKVVNGSTTDLQQAVEALTSVENSGLQLNEDFKNVTGLRASANKEIALAAFYLRSETGANYGLNALPFLSIVQGATNLPDLPYAMSSQNGQGAYQISPLSKALFTNSADKRIPYTWIVEMQTSGPKTSWITKYPGTKYPDDRVSDNDIIIYRLADIYLLKAEALAALNDIQNAAAYLNKVRTRAGIGNYSGDLSKQSMEKEILNERGRELFFENKRWYDLVRFHSGGTINVYNYVPNLQGKTTPLFWPINSTVMANNGLITQTQGY